jgi:hypothetical protein
MSFLFPHVPALMIPAGLAMLVLGIRRGSAGLRRYHRDPPRALALLRGFRISIVGLCMAGVGAGWLWDIDWLVGLSLIIGGEELLESTVVITAMTHGTGSGTGIGGQGSGIAPTNPRPLKPSPAAS